MGCAVLRTHGGLGNQIFQILFGRLFAEQRSLELKEVHDIRYKHAFSRSTAVSRAQAPGSWQSMLSAARVPKILQRLGRRDESPFWFGRTAYLDGYFQTAADYEQFSAVTVARHLDRLAGELKIQAAGIEGCLVHLRLGDFFADRAEARRHALERLRAVAPGSWLMTNDEALLREPDIAAAMTNRDVTLVSTKGMSAEDVLRTMAGYRMIDANDSTLTFWSSVLGGCVVPLRDQRLRICRDMLVRCRASGHGAS